jgi:hypothetical protein
MRVLWDMAIILTVEALRRSEMSVYFNETTRIYIPENCHFQFELEGSSRGLILMYYHSPRLDKLKRNTKNLSHYNRPPGRDLNAQFPEYEAGVLATRPRRGVRSIPK